MSSDELVEPPDAFEALRQPSRCELPAGVVFDEHVMMRRPEQVEAALAYYAEFTDEVDAQIEANRAAAEEPDELWRRQRDLPAR